MSVEAALEHFIIEQEKGFAQLRERQKQTDEQLKQTDEQLKANAKAQKKTDEQINKLLNKSKEYDGNWGKLMEALIEPAVLGEFKKRGIDVKETYKNAKRKLPSGEEIEINILAVDGDMVVLIEVKTTLNREDVNRHIQKRLSKFSRYFPRYEGCKIFGAVAYIKAVQEAQEYAREQGLFTLTLKNENLATITSREDFVPKDFRALD